MNVHSEKLKLLRLWNYLYHWRETETSDGVRNDHKWSLLDVFIQIMLWIIIASIYYFTSCFLCKSIHLNFYSVIPLFAFVTLRSITIFYTVYLSCTSNWSHFVSREMENYINMISGAGCNILTLHRKQTGFFASHEKWTLCLTIIIGITYHFNLIFSK